MINEKSAAKADVYKRQDMYRLDSADELFDIGWDDYLRRGAVCAVEWSEKVEDAFFGDEIVLRTVSYTHLVKLSSRQRKKYTQAARNSSAKKRHAVPTCRSRKDAFSRRKKTLTARPTPLSAGTKLLPAR